MRRHLQVLALAAVAAALTLASAAPAGAAPSDPFVFKGSFDGSGTPFGSFLAGNVVVNHETGNVLVFDEATNRIDQFDSAGNPVDFSALGSPSIQTEANGRLAIDNNGGSSQGNIYLAQDRGPVWGFGADGAPLAGFPLNPNPAGYACGIAVDANGHIWIPSFPFAEQLPAFAPEFTPAGTATGSQAELTEIPQLDNCLAAFDGHGHLYLNSRDGKVHRYDQGNGFVAEGPIGASSGNQIAIDPSTNDVFVDHGGSITATRYSDPLVASAPFETVPGLSSAGLALDASGQTMYVAEGEKVDIFHREPATAPTFAGAAYPSGVTTTTARVNWDLDAGAAPASYHFEYGTDTSYGSRFPAADKSLKFSPFTVGYSEEIEGLQPGTAYHLRVVATNSAGTTYGPDMVFATYQAAPGGFDPCPNALARKQTGAQALLDCRAYELVSASDTGGYDVESYLAPGQSPFPGFPLATDKLLYATHSGAVPGPWNATNKGSDPYLATRTSSGWSTQYEGLPANLNPAAGSFSSVLGEADSGLNTLAFAGPGLCSPCFGSGLEAGIPVRMPSGELVQGMSGSMVGSVPASAKPEGKVAKYFSGDGKDLLFASKYAFEPSANTNGDLTVYERNLASGTTEIVSTDASGNALIGTVSELGVSSNGSRVVTAKRVSVDSAGNEYLHPYLHIAGDAHGVDLAPGTSSGVLFAGMSEDGSKVFLTTADKLTGADTDSSPDLYEAEVDPSGNLALKLVTNANSDACNPVANANGEHWNTTGANADCGAVAIGGGGGVASATGAVYFLSPESFGGQGALNQPNLYLAQPSGGISFVATLEPDNPLVLDSVKANGTRRTGDFQVAPSGSYAAFASARSLTRATTNGNLEVFRFQVSTGSLDCVSCDPTHTPQPGGSGDASLAPSGLSLTDDGRVFFTTPLALVIADTDNRSDVYEWEDGATQLISSGISPFDSALLSASADGTDAFFFTHDTLAAEEDGNGQLVKIYDARAGGGFFKLPASVPCQASDECHGPGTPVPGPADIKSSGTTSNGNVLSCAKNRVKHRGKCVKQQKKHAKKHRKKKRKAATAKRAAKTNGKRGGRNA